MREISYQHWRIKMPRPANTSSTLSKIRNLPDGESIYRIRIHDTDTGCRISRCRDGDWRLDDPAHPYGNVRTWPTLKAARADLERLATQYRFLPGNKGIERLSDRFQPQSLTQAFLLSKI